MNAKVWKIAEEPWDGSFCILRRHYQFNKYVGTTMCIEGITPSAETVTFETHGFDPRFYVRNRDGDVDKEALLRVLEYLDKVVLQSEKRFESYESCIKGVTVVEKRDQNTFLIEDSRKFAEVRLLHPQMVGIFARYLAYPRGAEFEENTIEQWCPLELLELVESLVLYESNVPFELVYEVHTGITTCSWYRLDMNVMRLCEKKRSRFNYEFFSVNWKRLREWKLYREDMPPIRTLAFDIETDNSTGRKFPDAKIHQVFQICAYCFVSSRHDGKFERFAWILGDAESASDVHKFEFQEETKLLEAFFDAMCEFDPDLIVGHNSNGFDFPYLRARAKHLGFEKSFHESFSRWNNKNVRLIKSLVKHFTRYEVDIPGRLCADTMLYRRQLINSYDCRLSACAKEFLSKKTKFDLPPDKISIKQRTRDGRSILLHYCLIDTELVMLLYNVWNLETQMVSMGRRGVPPMVFLNREISKKVEFILAIEFGKRDMLYIDKKFFRRLPVKELFVEMSERGKSIKGAITIEQEPGYYCEEFPEDISRYVKVGAVVCNDFEALYPSNIIAYNIGSDTVGSRAEFEALGYVVEKDFVQMCDFNFSKDPAESGPRLHSEYAPCFLKKSVKCSVVAGVLHDMLLQRREKKKKLAELKRLREVEPSKKIDIEIIIADSLQLYLKLVMNSIYGAYAFKDSRMNNFALADSITRGGRFALERTRQIVWDSFRYDVVYGDTDSAFIRLRPGDDPMKAMAAIADRVGSVLGEHFTFAPEKAFKILLLPGAKKHYQDLRVPYGMAAEKAFIVTSGCPFSKRRMCKFVAKTCFDLQHTLFKLPPEQRLDAFKRCVKEALLRLNRGEVPLSDLIEQQKLSKNEEDYASENIAIRVAMREWRDSAAKSATPPPKPSAGDIVTWVICEESDGTETKTKRAHAWSPGDVARRGLTPMISHYREILERQLTNEFSVAYLALSNKDPQPEYLCSTKEQAKKHRSRAIRSLLSTIPSTSSASASVTQGIGRYFAKKRKREIDIEEIGQRLEALYEECYRCVAGSDDLSRVKEEHKIDAKSCENWVCETRGMRLLCERSYMTTQ